MSNLRLRCRSLFGLDVQRKSTCREDSYGRLRLRQPRLLHRRPDFVWPYILTWRCSAPRRRCKGTPRVFFNRVGAGLDATQGLVIPHPVTTTYEESQEPRLWIRDSMAKIKYSDVDPSMLTVDIVRTSHAKPARTSAEILVNLGCNGIGFEVFSELMKARLLELVNSLIWDDDSKLPNLSANLERLAGLVGRNQAILAAGEARARGFRDKPLAVYDDDEADSDEEFEGDSGTTRPRMNEEIAICMLHAGFTPQSCNYLTERLKKASSKHIDRYVKVGKCSPLYGRLTVAQKFQVELPLSATGELTMTLLCLSSPLTIAEAFMAPGSEREVQRSLIDCYTRPIRCSRRGRDLFPPPIDDTAAEGRERPALRRQYPHWRCPGKLPSNTSCLPVDSPRRSRDIRVSFPPMCKRFCPLVVPQPRLTIFPDEGGLAREASKPQGCRILLYKGIAVTSKFTQWW